MSFVNCASIFCTPDQECKEVFGGAICVKKDVDIRFTTQGTATVGVNPNQQSTIMVVSPTAGFQIPDFKSILNGIPTTTEKPWTPAWTEPVKTTTTTTTSQWVAPPEPTTTTVKPTVAPITTRSVERTTTTTRPVIAAVANHSKTISSSKTTTVVPTTTKSTVATTTKNVTSVQPITTNIVVEEDSTTATEDEEPTMTLSSLPAPVKTSTYIPTKIQTKNEHKAITIYVTTHVKVPVYTTLYRKPIQCIPTTITVKETCDSQPTLISSYHKPYAYLVKRSASSQTYAVPSMLNMIIILILVIKLVKF